MKSLIASEPERRPALRPASAERPAVIQLEEVTVEYRASRERIRSLKEYAIRLLQGGIRHEEFRALRNVSFTVRAGEVFGVIGHNGAGKSTLLKAVSRVIKPTSGRVWVRGRIAPLLELGAGFHPELTGRENIFLNATLLGHSHAAIEARFDEILDFAELWDFIDAPLRTYSTGMTMRLGFAAATAIRPDILLVDEVLSVGDERFQHKCAARMAEFRASGTTVLLVTHDAPLALEMCGRAVWLDHGTVAALGEVADVVAAYHAANERLAAGPAQHGVASAVMPAQPTVAAPTAAEINRLEEVALQRSWLYQFELPSGRHTECFLPPPVAPIHATRWQMLTTVLNDLSGARWDELSCLDLGCGEGYFAVQLARGGCRQVIGVDARQEQVAAAELIRQIWQLDNLQFQQADLLRLTPADLEPCDVVLLCGLLYQLEDPLGALRVAKSLARRAIIVETQLAPELKGQMEWGGAEYFKPIMGAFAVLDQTNESNSPYGSLTSTALCPSRQALLWAMNQLGCKSVVEITPPPGAYEQFARGQRAVVVGYI